MGRPDVERAASAFGALLKTYRTQAGISQEQLAERAGVSVSAVGALEQGIRRAPYRDTIEKLSDALDLAERERAQLARSADAARGRHARAASPTIKLPTPQTSFINRSEVDDIAALLASRRFVTITGAGGIGKTRTAMEAARLVAERGVDCCFVDLSTVSDESSLWTAIAAAREMPPVGSEALPDAVCRNVAVRPLLLVIDNCEHVIAYAADAVRALLARAPSLCVLTTSRERLGLSSELVYRLPSMATPTALRLLIERAEASDAHAHEAFDNVDLLAEICRMLEGIPLAIELAAFHLASLGPDAVRARLHEGLSLLGPRDLPQRHQTMTAAIAWSFDLLEPSERTVIERVAVFAGGFTNEAAQRICADDKLTATDISASLMRLVQKSLVQVERAGDEARYSLLETVRSFASQQLVRRGAEAQMRRRHLLWLAAVAEDFSNARPRRSAATLYCEMENIRSALRYALSSGEERDVVAAGTIVGRLRLVWYSLERNAELQSWAERLLVLLRETEHAAIIAHLCVALVNCAHRDPDAVLLHGERAVRLLQQTEDFELAASVSGNIALRLVLRGRGAEAERVLSSCSAWIESPAARGTLNLLAFLGNRANVRRRLEQFDAAREDLERILDTVDEKVDLDNHFRIHAMISLAAVKFETGDAREASRLGQALIDRFRPSNDEPSFWLAVAFGELGSYHVALDDLDGAERNLLTSVRMLRELAAECDVFFLYLACVLARRGELAKAAQMLGFVDAWYERTGYTMARNDAQFRLTIVDALHALSPHDRELLQARGTRQTFADVAAIVGC